MSELRTELTEKLTLVYEHLSLDEAVKLVDYWAKSRYSDKFFDENIDHERVPCTFLMCDDIGEGTGYGEDYTVVFGPFESKTYTYNDKNWYKSIRSDMFHMQELNALRNLIKKDLNID